MTAQDVKAGKLGYVLYPFQYLVVRVARDRVIDIEAGTVFGWEKGRRDRG